MLSTRERLFTGLGIAMVVALIWAASEPATGEVFPNVWHYLAHFAAFGALAALWTLGLPRVRAVYLALAIVAFGFLHEAYEISGHVHGFELEDAIVDGVGAILGIVATRAYVLKQT